MENDQKMTETEFLRLLDNLADSFNMPRLEQRVVAAYWAALKNVSKNMLNDKATEIIMNDKRFPAISRLMPKWDEI